MMMIMSDLS